MANVTSVTKHWITAKEGFTTTTSGTVSSGAGTVGLNSVAGYTNGDTVALVIDPTDAAKKQVFTGTIDTSGSQVTGVVWTEGTNQAHSAGAQVVDYETATAWAAYAKGLKVSHNDDGSLKPAAVNTALGITGTTPADYTVLPQNPATVTANGNRSYTMTFSGVDLTGTLNPGYRLRSTRTVAAPTQSTSLNGTSQYWSKTSPVGMTSTDDFVAGAWVKLSNYPTGAGAIISRYNGTSGWELLVLDTGQVVLRGFNAGSSNLRGVQSYQSIPLNKWVHISAQLDMSAYTVTPTTMYIMIDGVEVPAVGTQSGTNPTALIQAGNLEVGSRNAGLFFPGKIAQAFVSSAKITQANVRTLISQGPTSALITANNIISAYSFDGVATDLNTTNANNLTAAGSATATNADSPFGGQANGTISSTLDYGIVQKVSFSTDSTVTVQAAEGCTFPTSGGISSINYSAMRSPIGFPGQRGKWRSFVAWKAAVGMSSTSNSPNSGLVSGTTAVSFPAGENIIDANLSYYTDTGTVTQIFHEVALSTSQTSFTGDMQLSTAVTGTGNGSGATYHQSTHIINGDLSLATATTYYVVAKGVNANGNALGSPALYGVVGFTNAYL